MGAVRKSFKKYRVSSENDLLFLKKYGKIKEFGARI